MDDEIIVELRAQKEAFAASAGFDIRRLAAQIRLEEALSLSGGCRVLQPAWRPVAENLLPAMAASSYRDIRFAP